MVVTDLRSATPFTYVETYYATDCDALTMEYTVSYTAQLQMTNYIAPSEVATIGPSSLAYVTYTFPELTVSALRPRDVLTMVVYPFKRVLRVALELLSYCRLKCYQWMVFVSSFA
jgi:hypothetical protein